MEQPQASKKKMKERMIDFFFEEEDVEKKKEPWYVVVLNGESLLVILLIASLSIIVPFSFTYNLRMNAAVESLCASTVEKIRLSSVSKGGVFEVSTSNGPLLIELDPIKGASDTYFHMNCSIVERDV